MVSLFAWYRSRRFSQSNSRFSLYCSRRLLRTSSRLFSYQAAVATLVLSRFKLRYRACLSESIFNYVQHFLVVVEHTRVSTLRFFSTAPCNEKKTRRFELLPATVPPPA